MFVVLLEPEDPKEVTWSTYLRKVSAAGKSISHLFHRKNHILTCYLVSFVTHNPFSPLVHTSHPLPLLLSTDVLVMHPYSHRISSKNFQCVIAKVLLHECISVLPTLCLLDKTLLQKKIHCSRLFTCQQSCRGKHHAATVWSLL